MADEEWTFGQCCRPPRPADIEEVQRIRGALGRSISAGVMAPAVPTAVIPWAEASTGDVTGCAIPATASRSRGVTLSPGGSLWSAESAANAMGHPVGGT